MLVPKIEFSRNPLIRIQKREFSIMVETLNQLVRALDRKSIFNMLESLIEEMP
jgi:hypothetical protein